MSNETQPQGQSKPDSPGLWEREGKFWRVWEDNTKKTNAEEIYANGFTSILVCWNLVGLPTGNWRKVSHILTDAEHAEWEAGKAKAKELADENARLLKAIADDRPNGKWLDRFGACRVCEGEIPHGHTLDCDLYKMERQIKELEQTISDTRSAAGLETDQSADEEKPISPTMLRRFRKAAHDIGSLFTWSVQNLKKFPPPPGKEWLDEIKERLLAGANSPAPPVPEVIEGSGQVLENGAWYVLQRVAGETPAAFLADENVSNNIAHAGCRYIKLTLPTFPPRPTFTAPPKPEAPYDLFEMTQGDNKGKYFWGFRNIDMGLGKGADLVIDGELRFYTTEWCRQVHRETGKPVELLNQEGEVIG